MSQDLPPSSESSGSEPEVSELQAASLPAVAPSSEPELSEPELSAIAEEMTTAPDAIEPFDSLTPSSLEETDVEETDLKETEPPLPKSTPTSTSSPRAENAQRSSARTPPVNDEVLPQTLVRLLGEAVVAAQPRVKQQSIKALRGTIHLLEGVIERLEAAPQPKNIRGKAPTPETTAESGFSPAPASDTKKLASPQSSLQTTVRGRWQQFQQLWRRLLRQVRDRLPTGVKRHLSDRALTAAIVSSIVILLWSTAALLPTQPKPTPKPTTVATSPTANATPTPLPTPVQTPIPPLVKAPEPPKPVDISPSPVKPSPPPSPPLKMTPEQTLIARIQDQVAAISNQYVSGLIQSVQANFRSSRLIVSVSDGWYGLSRSQQDKLADEILHRTQALDFIKLELVNSEGTLLARSPVVGSEMVILQRTNTPNQV